jgi:dTDP-4-dehydrorhamnose reductase
MKLMVLGAMGMVGWQVFKTALDRNLDVCGVVRNRQSLAPLLKGKSGYSIREIDDIRNIPALEKIIQDEKPDYLINAVGIVVQLPQSKDYYESLSINALLPHQLEKLGTQYGFRLIQISTDCVFNGQAGMYAESDLPDAEDLYGKTKELGEVGYGSGITLRTSLIGHEIVKPVHGLLDWFLSQEAPIKGFTTAYFSGLTTIEFAKVLLDVFIPAELPAGIYHLASERISKYDLLKLVAEVYQKNIHIEPSADWVVDRSLDGSLFNCLTGYVAPSWITMLENLRGQNKI